MQSATQDLGSLIDKMAAKLSVPVAHLWEVLARQARNDAVSDLVSGGIWIVLAVGVFALLTYGIRYADHPDNRVSFDAERFWFRVLRVVVPVAAVIVAINFAVQAWQKTANPEYYALREVLGVLK